MIWIVLIQILFVGINLWMAAKHKELILENKRINHALWGGSYFIAAFLTAFVSWWLAASLLLIRLPLFNTVLNKLRGLPLFYLGKESAIDRLIKNIYPEVFYCCIIGFFICEIILFV